MQRVTVLSSANNSVAAKEYSRYCVAQMATFVPLREDHPAFELVALLELLKLGPEERQVKQQEAEQRAERLADAAANEPELADKDMITYKDTELGKLVTEGKYSEFLEKGFFANMPTLLAASPEDLNAGFSIAFAILPSAVEGSKPPEVMKLIEKFVTPLSEGVSPEKALLNLELLSILFNLMDSPSIPLPVGARHPVLVKILHLVLDTGNSSMLMGQLDALDIWVAEWNLSKADQAELYRLVAQLHQETDRLSFQDYAYKYLKAVQGANAEELGRASEQAAALVLFALQSCGDGSIDRPSCELDRLLALNAVQALSTTKHGKLVDLLSIFVNDQVQEYLSFYADHKDFVDECGLSHEDNLENMRSLTISGLGMTQERIPYADLQSKLALESKEEVEEAVIAAVVSGCVFAKIDEANEQVVILKTTRRQFKDSDWKTLSDKLSSWKEVIRGVIRAVDEVQRAPG